MNARSDPNGASNETWLALVAGAVVAALWMLASMVGFSSGSDGTRGGAAVALIAAAVALGAAALALAVIRWQSDSATRASVRLLSRYSGAALLSNATGRIVAANDAAGAGPRKRAVGLEGALSEFIETDASVIYRLARGATTVGFALEEVRTRELDKICYLTARSVGPDLLLWSLLSPGELSVAMPGSVADQYESAPFCHAVIEDGLVVSTNVRFRASFGFEPGKPLDARLESAFARPGQYLLPQRDGSFALMRSFISQTGTGEPEAQSGLSSRDRREVFLFALGTDEALKRSPGLGLERVPAALVQLTAEARITWLNDAARRMLGKQAVPGVGIGDLVEHRGRPLKSLIDAAMVGQEMTRAETVRIVGSNPVNPQSFAQITFARVELDGEESVLGVLTDASELRQLEDKFAQSQKMEAVGKLAGGVAHDFNNLLTAINGHCDLLLLGRDPTSPDHADLTQIRQNANRAAALVRQLLAFSRKQTLKPELVSLKDVVTDTLYLLDRLIGDRVVLDLDTARDERPPVVRADRQQVEQALMNLVVNARDAMPDGGTVTISTRSRLFSVDETRFGATVPAGDYVELAVADEGTGIDEAVMGKVFDPFFTTKPLGEGTGLGLSTVYGIVKQSGGFIFAENRPEGGACFRILLRRADGAPTSSAQPRPADASEETFDRPDLTGEAKILLVEDEASVRSVAMRALGMRGHAVTAVESAVDALAHVENLDREIDVIITDVMMPEMDGPTFIERARAVRPDVKVLFISGYAEEAFRKDLADPSYAFLAKPFSIGDLTAKVKEVLETPRAA